MIACRECECWLHKRCVDLPEDWDGGDYVCGLCRSVSKKDFSFSCLSAFVAEGGDEDEMPTIPSPHRNRTVPAPSPHRHRTITAPSLRG